MKRIGSKGQGAMEYLMTYGWAILVVMIVGVVLWQLGVFNVGQSNLVTTGWNKVRPLSPTVSYRSTAFRATFVNGVGTSIKVASTSLHGNETVSGTNCTFVLGGGTSPLTVKAGDTFTLNGTCSSASKSDGEPYDMEVVIAYNSTMSGINTEHTESGHIKGQAES